MGGGVALNCVINGKILGNNLVEDLWIQPAAGDAGNSLGCALNYYYQILNNKRNTKNKDLMSNSYLGPKFTNEEVKDYLDDLGAKYTFIQNEDKLLEIVSKELVDNKIIAWHQGRMEFGPRALGNRSIIANPTNKEMQSKINLKIKFRESFRPFAPSILEDKVDDWFELKVKSPYMLLVMPIKPNRYNKTSNELFFMQKLKNIDSQIPAITHVDYSARIQTVNKEDNLRYFKLINSFYKKSNCPIIVNTSFNVRGEPIVCTPYDSYKCFMRTDIDILVIENFILYKNLQNNFEDEKKDWEKEYELD